ncbi:hypothetical protein [Candidatus Regiella endosymbiont of Tuberolachnus salignus]|uniref:hypothetical protein n=1 Tax=Candidatus Regiella endosymbiont of Tuberolachnus salignus TaxID=3077956 RepID=UPI0030D26BF9
MNEKIASINSTEFNGINSDDIVAALAPSITTLSDSVAAARAKFDENGSPGSAVALSEQMNRFQALATALSTALKTNNTINMTPINHIGR